MGFCLAVPSFSGRHSGDGAEALRTSIYLWQRVWSAPVRNAVREAGPHVDSLMILVGELGSGEVRPDWETIATVDRPVTLVIRIPELFGEEMKEDTLQPFVGKLTNWFSAMAGSASAEGVRIAGVQLDYDCPTSKLSRYGDFLEAFRCALPDTTPSFTVLPTWLRADTFKPVARNADYFVLQVHSLEAPTSVDSPMRPCDVSKLDAYLDAASAVGVPYHLALPTYGYHVAFDGEGGFAGLSPEGPTPAQKILLNPTFPMGQSRFRGTRDYSRSTGLTK